MLCIMKFDNCKKLSKITKLSKRMIRTVDSLDMFDVGYDNDSLVIAIDACDIYQSHVYIHRTTFGMIAVHKWHGIDHESTWYDADAKSQAEAFWDALAWVNNNA